VGDLYLAGPEGAPRRTLTVFVVGVDRDRDPVEVPLDAGFGPELDRPGRRVDLARPGEEIRVRGREAVTDRRLDLLASRLADHRPDDVAGDLVERVEHRELFALLD